MAGTNSSQMFQQDVKKLLCTHPPPHSQQQTPELFHQQLLKCNDNSSHFFFTSYIFCNSMFVEAFLIKYTSKNCQKWQFCGARPKLHLAKMVTHYCQNGNKIINSSPTFYREFQSFIQQYLASKKKKEKKNKRLKNGNYTLTSMLPCELT